MRIRSIQIRHFAEISADQTSHIKILCTTLNLQDEPDTFTVYQGKVQEIPQTLLNRKVDCWEVKEDTLHIFVSDLELTEAERWNLCHEG